MIPTSSQSVAIKRQAYFNSALPRECFEENLEQVTERYRFVVCGYVVMPEHIHLLVSESEHGNLAVALQVLKQKTARRLKVNSEKAFWQTRYYDFNVFTHNKRVEKLKYMHRNPVTRGLVKNPEDWPWSTFRHYRYNEPTPVQITSM